MPEQEAIGRPAKKTTEQKTADLVARTLVISSPSIHVHEALDDAVREANECLTDWAIAPAAIQSVDQHIIPEMHLNRYMVALFYQISATPEQAAQIDEYMDAMDGE